MAVRLMGSFSLVIVVISAAFMAVGVGLIRERIVGEAQEKVRRDLNAAREIYQGELRHVSDVVRWAADRTPLMEALRTGNRALALGELQDILQDGGLEGLAVTDARGKVLLRASNAGLREGASGLELFRWQGADLVFVDLKMPGHSGFDVLQEIVSADLSTVAIVITGYVTISSAVEAMQTGAYDFLPKPFAPDESRVITQRGLERHRLVLETMALRPEREMLREPFAAIVSHELKAPLGAVQQNLYALALELDPLLTEAQRDRFQRIQPSLDRLLNLVHTWLKAHSTDLESLQASFRPVSVQDVSCKAAAVVEPHAVRKDVEMRTVVQARAELQLARVPAGGPDGHRADAQGPHSHPAASHPPPGGIQTHGGAGAASGQGPIKTYALFPGCSLEKIGQSCRHSAEEVCRSPGIGLKELPDWNCCGATAYFHVDELLAHTLCARNLAQAEQPGLDVVAPCAACYKNMFSTNEYLKIDPDLAEHINFALGEEQLRFAATVAVHHLLARDIASAMADTSCSRSSRFTPRRAGGCVWERMDDYE